MFQNPDYLKPFRCGIGITLDGHAELFHHADGGGVVVLGRRHHTAESPAREQEINDCMGSFGRIPFPLLIGTQSPKEAYLRCEV